MLTLSIHAALLLLLAQLVPLDPQLAQDEVISVTCPLSISCWLLDRAGNLFFSSDGGRTRVKRANHRALGLFRIRFSGLIEGFGLDRSGELWATQDGGRSFFRARVPARIGPIADVAPGSPILAASRGGVLLQWEGRATGFQVSQNHLPAGFQNVQGLAVGPGGEILFSTRQGDLLISRDRGRHFAPIFLPEKAGARPEALLSGAVSERYELLWLDDKGRTFGGSLTQSALAPWSDAVAGAFTDVAAVQDGWLLAGSRGLVRMNPGEGHALSSLGSAPMPGIREILRSRGENLLLACEDGKLLQFTFAKRAFQPLAGLPGRIVRMDLAPSRRGLALGADQEIWTTRDNGLTWTALGQWKDLALKDVAWVGESHIWAVGESGAFLHSVDAGRSWTAGKLPSPSTLYAVRFADEKNGWAVGGNQTIVRTQDGGKNWRKVHEGKGALFAILVDPAGNGWFGGEGGVLVYTEDDGKTFAQATLPGPKTVRAIAFADPARGIAVGDEGMAWITRDGGERWSAAWQQTEASLWAVTCHPTTAHCLVAGERGLLLTGNPF